MWFYSLGLGLYRSCEAPRTFLDALEKSITYLLPPHVLEVKILPYLPSLQVSEGSAINLLRF